MSKYLLPLFTLSTLALEKKPDVIATSCPFCKIMISSGINEKGLSDQVGVMDVMELVAQNMAQPTPS